MYIYIDKVVCVVKLRTKLRFFPFRFGNEVMDTVATWTKNLCLNLSQGGNAAAQSNHISESGETIKDLSSWSVLDVGTGNGLLLQALAKQG